MTEVPFSEAMKAARAATGLTQQKLSERTLIPKRTIEDWERGKATPPPYVQRFVLNELADIANESK
ncbi:MAG: helix-turn-helix transcriptional regulator [Clostridia bacterium]|nr:helix-turn-helix transcriptional regulator [Clostridia bacterium]